MAKPTFDQEQFDEIIDYGKYPFLADKGSDDEEGYQIFTPEFIVKDMIKLIGIENISDIYKTVLEPTSGDGAFTVRILEMRLKKIVSDPKYIQKSLIALSTIYSIEMDEKLIKKQRNNIFTLLVLFAKKTKQQLTNEYIKVAKTIILTNYIWGETNIDKPLMFVDQELGWYMPTLHKNKSTKEQKNKIKFAKWFITDDVSKSTFELEDWEYGKAKSDYSDWGGIFGE